MAYALNQLRSANSDQEKSSGYRVPKEANGNAHNPRYHTECANTDCLIYGANVDYSDPQTQAYLSDVNIELASDMLDLVGKVADFFVFRGGGAIFRAEAIGTTADIAKAGLNEDPYMLSPNLIGAIINFQLNHYGMPDAYGNRIGTAAEMALDASLEDLRNDK